MYGQPSLRSKVLVWVSLVCISCCVSILPRAEAADTWPEAGVGNIPAAVDKLVVAFDGWGGDVLDPWQYLGTGQYPLCHCQGAATVRGQTARHQPEQGAAVDADHV
jgi:hypothetical protein